jgi:hypothetical protein
MPRKVRYPKARPTVSSQPFSLAAPAHRQSFPLLPFHSLLCWEGSLRAEAEQQHDPEARGLTDSPNAIVLDFEGCLNGNLVGSFYAGVGGPNYGAVCGPAAKAVVDLDLGLVTNLATCPSGATAMLFSAAAGAHVTVASGFTDHLSLQVAALVDGAVTVFDGPDGTGNILATLPIGTSSGACCGGSLASLLCLDPIGKFGAWQHLTVPFSGVAKSIKFTGNNLLMLVDDITIIPAAVVPPVLAKTTYWLWNPLTNKVVSELKNNAALCIALPYNIEVRPSAILKKAPVTLALKTELGATVFVYNDYVKPFYLWGDVTAVADVLVNTKPLAKGTYFLECTIDGVVEKIKFTKTC